MYCPTDGHSHCAKVVDKTLRKFSRVELQDYLEDTADTRMFKSHLETDPYLGPLFESSRRKKKAQG